MYLIVGDWSTHKRLQRLGADGSSIPQAPGTLNEIGEGACEEVCRTQFQELRDEGRDASPPSVTAHQGAQSTVCFEESEKETSCIVLGIDVQEFVGEIRQKELLADEFLELGVVVHEHPSQVFAAAPSVDVRSCKGFAVAEVLPNLFEAEMFVHYFLALGARPIIADRLLLRPKLAIEVQVTRWVEGL